MPRQKLPGTYYSRNKAKCQGLVAQWQKANPTRVMWLAARHRARRDGREFDIELGDVQIPELCPIFGTPMENPQLDRKDSTKGYVKGNVAVLSARANRLKSDATIEELEAIIRYMRS